MSSGHGHVIPNADGTLARCGGPRICRECALEFQTFQAKINAETVREQQREIARLQGLLAEILADDKACGYLNASLSQRMHQVLGNLPE